MIVFGYFKEYLKRKDKEVEDGKLLSKNLVKFYQYNGRFFNPIQQLADQFNQLQSAFASSERLFEILDKTSIL